MVSVQTLRRAVVFELRKEYQTSDTSRLSRGTTGEVFRLAS